MWTFIEVSTTLWKTLYCNVITMILTFVKHTYNVSIHSLPRTVGMFKSEFVFS